MNDEYIAYRCAKCGKVNVIKNGIDGLNCVECSGGPLIPIGYASQIVRSTGIKL